MIPSVNTEKFWKSLQTLCGKAFAGMVAADTANSPDFAGKALVMHVRSCGKDRIRIPFFVGDDWIAAGDLHEGDLLTLADGTTAPLEKIRIETLDAPVTVYNFEVADVDILAGEPGVTVGGRVPRGAGGHDHFAG